MSHGDEAVNFPEGFEVVARSQQGAVAAVEDNNRRFYGLQYHSELKSSREVASYHGDVDFPSAHAEGGSKNTNEKISKSFVDPVLLKSHAPVNSPANATIRSAVPTEQKQANSASTKVGSPAVSAASTAPKHTDSVTCSVGSPDIGSAATTGQKQADSTTSVDFPDIGSAAITGQICRHICEKWSWFSVWKSHLL